jgi:chemotaxis protein MotB
MFWLAGVSFLALAAVGCVPQEKYNAMKLAHDSAMERLAQADAQAKAAIAESEARKQQLELLAANSGNQSGLVTNLTTQLTELQSRYGELERQYQEALNKQGTMVVALPQEVSNALTQFANENPDLVDFDSARGIVKFKSDVTFAVGSAELRPEARNAIARFAQILNLPSASGYELQVAGHTDSQRVSNPATLKAGHKDNWYLSSHRAISVGKELQAQRVDSRRIAVVGYADQHPIASNASEAGRAQNRRVEVLILPNQVKSSTIAEAPAAAPVKATAAPKKGRPAELNKDTAGASVDQRPFINK